ncbi:MAG TPA: helix-turn-helix domain-containing protein [Solirubrobacteraceae bacterium]|jgi:y4mF family transcriptional regulator
MSSDETTSKRIGRSVREARHRQGIDQAKLALIANVAVRSVHRVENGEPTVRLDVLTRILSALGLELEVRRRSGG